MLQNPRANGMVDWVDQCISDSLQCMLSAAPDCIIEELMGEILAGLRFPPNQLSFESYILAFK